MRLLFVSIQVIECRLQHHVAEILKREGVTVSYLTLSRQAEREMKALGEDIVCIHDLLARVASEVDTSEAAIQALEEKYGLTSLKEVYYADRASKYSREKALVQKTLRYFRAWEAYLQEHPVDCIFLDLGAEVLRMVGYYVAKHSGLPALMWWFKPFPKPMLFKINTFEEAFVTEEDMRPLTAEERAEVEAYVSEFRQEKKPFIAPLIPKISFDKVKEFCEVLYAAIFIERGQHEHLRPFRFSWRHITRTLKKYAYYLLYKKPDFNVKYALFPLHVSEDFKISVIAPHCVDQEYIISQCAAALPPGYKLYLKEHPSFIGGTTFGEIWRLTRIENVELIPPTTDMKKLLKNASLVMVISSTAGYEALLFHKPVVVLGTPFYSRFGFTFDVDNLLYLRQTVKQALQARDFIDQERLYAFIHAHMRISYPGTHAVWDRSPANLEADAHSVAAKLREMGLLKPAPQIAEKGDAECLKQQAPAVMSR